MKRSGTGPWSQATRASTLRSRDPLSDCHKSFYGFFATTLMLTSSHKSERLVRRLERLGYRVIVQGLCRLTNYPVGLRPPLQNHMLVRDFFQRRVS